MVMVMVMATMKRTMIRRIQKGNAVFLKERKPN
jgi:hypothetical protein